jgi:hypothetical protein
VITSWNDPEGPDVIIISAIGMTGINLAAARVMIMVVGFASRPVDLPLLTLPMQDQVFSNQEKRQFMGRIWRYPQKHVCIMYELILDDTCDDVIFNISQGKALMMDTFLEQGSASAAFMQSFFMQSSPEPILKGGGSISSAAAAVKHKPRPPKALPAELNPLIWTEYFTGAREYVDMKLGSAMLSGPPAPMENTPIVSHSPIPMEMMPTVAHPPAPIKVTWSQYFAGVAEYVVSNPGKTNKPEPPARLDIPIFVPSSHKSTVDDLFQNPPSPIWMPDAPSPTWDTADDYDVGTSLGSHDTPAMTNMLPDDETADQTMSTWPDGKDHHHSPPAVDHPVCRATPDDIDLRSSSPDPWDRSQEQPNVIVPTHIRPLASQLWYKARPSKPVQIVPTMSPVFPSALPRVNTIKSTPKGAANHTLSTRRAAYQNLTMSRLASVRNQATQQRERAQPSQAIDLMLAPRLPASSSADGGFYGTKASPWQ